MDELKKIYDYLKERTKYTKNIEVILNEPDLSTKRNLNLILNMKEGFSRYEKLEIAEGRIDFDVGYSSLVYNSFDTFLANYGLQKNIGDSETLLKFKKEVEKIKEEGNFEIAEKNKEIYTQFVSLTDEGLGVKELYDVIDFFAERFKDKINNPSNYTWRLLV